MSSMTDVGLYGRGRIERLLDAVADPARREPAVIGLLAAYVVSWTLYAVLAKGSQDIHPDMSEQFALGQSLAWGYSKHPPLAVWIVRAWFAVLPTADWAFYLLAAASIGVTLWIAWHLAGRYLHGDRRIVGLALLTFVPFFNFHALKFNANTVLMPFWAATTLAFIRSYETRAALPSALAGLAAAAAMYGKYWSIVLLLGLGVAAVAHPGRAAYFRSSAPWITVAVGALALAPHLVWLAAHDFSPFSYALLLHGAASRASTLQSVLGYLAGGVAYVALPVGALLLALRPSAAALRDMAWPTSPERRLAAAAFWAVLLLPAVLAPLARVQLVSLWSMSAWTLLPVMLLSSPMLAVSRAVALRIVALAIAFPLLMIAIAPAIALYVHRMHPPPGAAQSSVLAGEVERVWRETSDAPLRLFSSIDELTDGVVFYLRAHPSAVHVLDSKASPALEERIAREGIVLLCPADAHQPGAAWCGQAAGSLAGRHAAGRRVEVEAVRRYLGVKGEPTRYLIISIPPAQGRP
jgi:hypothetical protein